MVTSSQVKINYALNVIQNVLNAQEDHLRIALSANKDLKNQMKFALKKGSVGE